MTDSLDLVACGDNDLEFLYRVFASTREPELAAVPWSAEEKEQFLRLQFQAQHKHYQEYFPDAQYDLIVRNGAPIGRLYVDRSGSVITVIDIALLPEHRGQGIGTRLIRDILAEAKAAGKPVQLHVEHFNPAQRLYERFGFRKIDEYGVYYHLEWQPERARPD